MKTKASFEYVSHLLMIEEPEPTLEALARWQEMYPDHRDSLAEFFELWAEDVASPVEDRAPIDEAAEEAAIERAVSYAMDVLRKQGRLVPEDYVAVLQPFDQLVLSVVVTLGGAGYLANISRMAEEISGKMVFSASVYQSLVRLERLKMLVWRFADPVTESQNQGRQYYMATIAGERSLAHARAAAAQREAGFQGDFA